MTPFRRPIYWRRTTSLQKRKWLIALRRNSGPAILESVAGLAEVLLHGGREGEARLIVGEFDEKYPDQRKDLERISAAARIIGPGQPANP